MSTVNNEAEFLQTLVKLLEEANSKNAVGVAEVGACLISTPGNPRPTCAQITPKQCADLKGAYIGGKCP